MSFLKRLAQDEDGGPLVEAAVVFPMLLVFLFGAVDFLFAMSDWNAASKAAELGARLAAVSNPVADGLAAVSQDVLSSTLLPGGTMPSFTVTCSGSTSACSCSGTCAGYSPSFSLDALKTIVYGRGNSGSCNSSGGIYFDGMCRMYPGLQPANVVVTYAQTGLGFAGRPDGPVPTVKVSLQGLNFRFFFLGSLMGFGSIPLPITASAPTTMTGEALCSAPQPFAGISTPSTTCSGGA